MAKLPTGNKSAPFQPSGQGRASRSWIPEPYIQAALSSFTFFPPLQEAEAIAGMSTSLKCVHRFKLFFHYNLVIFARAKTCRQ